MQMCPDAFWHNQTFADFRRRTHYYHRDKTDQYQNSWEQTRWIVYASMLTKGVDATAAELMPFVWDKEGKKGKVKSGLMTKEEIDHLLKAHKLK